MFAAIRARRDWAIVAASLAVFIYALTQPAFRTLPPYSIGIKGVVVDPVTGYAFENLLIGWLLVPFAFLQMFWPNPTVGLLIIATLLLARYTWPILAIVVGCVAVLISTHDTTLGLASWLGNPVLFVSWYAYVAKKKKLSFILALIAAVLMLGFMTIKSVPYGLKEANIPIQEYDIGYWAWIASAAVMAVATLPIVITHRFGKHHDQEPSVFLPGSVPPSVRRRR